MTLTVPFHKLISSNPNDRPFAIFQLSSSTSELTSKLPEYINNEFFLFLSFIEKPSIISHSDSSLKKKTCLFSCKAQRAAGGQAYHLLGRQGRPSPAFICQQQGGPHPKLWSSLVFGAFRVIPGPNEPERGPD